MFGIGNNEPPAGATPQQTAETPRIVPSTIDTIAQSQILSPEETPSGGQQTPEQTAAIEKPSTGLVKEMEQARKAVADVQERMDKKGAEIADTRWKVFKKLGDLLGRSEEAGDDIVRSGTLVGRDGKELGVSIDGTTLGNTELLFDDLADPTRRMVQISFDDITLSEKDGIGIDEVHGFFTGGVSRTDFAKQCRRSISKDEEHAHLRGDLDRDVLDAAADGLGFISDPGTTLKPVEAPTAPAVTSQPIPTA